MDPAPGRELFDVVYGRFLLTHLPDPAAALANMRERLVPGGVLVVEDIDCTGHFCEPDSPAFRRFVELYTRTVQSRGGDPNIGPRLPDYCGTPGSPARPQRRSASGDLGRGPS